MNRRIALAALCAAWATNAAAGQFDRFAWERRPVLIFAPSPDHPDLVAQRAAFAATPAEIAERRIALIEITKGPAATALRRAFAVGAGDFAVILVGLDTFEKFRSGSPVAVSDLFARIDRMPMRRRELSRD